ncbi:glycosyltransferase family 2 protein [Wenyingzhuangia sp. IMCC45533]
MLAIIIPYYRREFFDQTLASLESQTDKRFNVYIGDDCSEFDYSNTDYIKRTTCNIVYKRFEDNLGGVSLVKHWERCLKMTSGEQWFMILGDDDVLPLKFVENFYKKIPEVENENINVIRYESVKIDHENTPISDLITAPKIESTVKFFVKRLKKETGSTLSEFIFKKSIFDEIGFKDYPLAWYSDVMLILEVSKMDRIYTVANNVVEIRRSGISISSTTNNLDEKNRATFDFFYDVIYNYSTKFNEDELKINYYFLEKAFLNDKTNKYFWSKYIEIVKKNKNFIRIPRFVIKCLKAKLKK